MRYDIHLKDEPDKYVHIGDYLLLNLLDAAVEVNKELTKVVHTLKLLFHQP